MPFPSWVLRSRGRLPDPSQLHLSLLKETAVVGVCQIQLMLNEVCQIQLDEVCQIQLDELYHNESSSMMYARSSLMRYTIMTHHVAIYSSYDVIMLPIAVSLLCVLYCLSRLCIVVLPVIREGSHGTIRFPWHNQIPWYNLLQIPCKTGSHGETGGIHDSSLFSKLLFYPRYILESRPTYPI